MPQAFINRIAMANPPHDVHDTFLHFGRQMLRHDNRRAALFVLYAVWGIFVWIIFVRAHQLGYHHAPCC